MAFVPENSALLNIVMSGMETARVFVRIAPRFVMKYDLISPRTVEPGQKERVLLMVAVYALSRQV